MRSGSDFTMNYKRAPLTELWGGKMEELITSTADKTGPKQYAYKQGGGSMSMFCHYM